MSTEKAMCCDCSRQIVLYLVDTGALKTSLSLCVSLSEKCTKQLNATSNDFMRWRSSQTHG